MGLDSRAMPDNIVVAAYHNAATKMLYGIPFNVTMLKPHVKGGILYQKLLACQRFVNHLPPSTFVIMIDAMDVMFGGCQRDIVKTFDSLGHKIVIGAEFGCWPPDGVCSKHPELFRQIRVWQQPCAIVDSVVWRGQLELEASECDQAGKALTPPQPLPLLESLL